MAAPERAIRQKCRDQAVARLLALPVQGKFGHLRKSAFLRTLEPSFHACVKVPADWRVFCLPNETQSELDLFPSLFRITRSIGGSWTELLHTDASALLQARAWAGRYQHGLLLCPLCLMETGDTRHVILGCRCTEPFRNLLRDKMEHLLISLASLEDHHSRAMELRDHSGRIFPQYGPQDPMKTRWPTLCVWGWLVTTSAHERFLRRHQTVGTAPRVEGEQAHDLSYRGIIPRDLGRTLLHEHSTDAPTPDNESFSYDSQSASVDHEVEVTSKRQQALALCSSCRTSSALRVAQNTFLIHAKNA